MRRTIAVLLLTAAAFPAHADSFAQRQCDRLRSRAGLDVNQSVTVECQAPDQTIWFRCNGPIARPVPPGHEWDNVDGWGLSATIESPRCAKPFAEE